MDRCRVALTDWPARFCLFFPRGSGTLGTSSPGDGHDKDFFLAAVMRVTVRHEGEGFIAQSVVSNEGFRPASTPVILKGILHVITRGNDDLRLFKASFHDIIPILVFKCTVNVLKRQTKCKNNRRNLFFFPDNIKRKLRRRPIWGRGIIRKKKSYKKEAEDDDDPEEEEEEAAEDSVAMVQDESSCDTMEPDKQPLQANGHVLSTEEENSCEPTATRDSPGEEEETDRAVSVGASVGKGSAAPVLQECVNGNESMDSIDSAKETEGGGKEVTAGLGSVTGGEVEPKPDEREESSAPECNAEESETMCDTDHEKEGTSCFA